jgi:hypothetical protein
MWMDELADFSSPFTVYVYVALLIMLIRIVAVLRPLILLFNKFAGSGLITSLFKLQRDANLKGIWALILQEVASATAPALFAFLLRMFIPLGDRQPEWTTATTLGFIAVLMAVLALQLRDVLRVRDFLTKLSGRISSFAIKQSVNIAVRTRRNLVALATMPDPEFRLIHRRNPEEVEAIFVRNTEGNLRLNAKELGSRGLMVLKNTQSATLNTLEASKLATKKVAGRLQQNMDASMQKQVDKVTVHYNPMEAFMLNLVMAFVPLLYIFLIMYR